MYRGLKGLPILDEHGMYNVNLVVQNSYVKACAFGIKFVFGHHTFLMTTYQQIMKRSGRIEVQKNHGNGISLILYTKCLLKGLLRKK